jgi:DNA uptake protein ComE-like DNA-binding protein
MLKDFWALSRSEQRGFVIVATLMCVALISLWVPIQSAPDANVTLLAGLSGLSDVPMSETAQIQTVVENDLVYFNPNHVTIKELEAMGLHRNVVINWKKFLEADGRFRHHEDILQVYGMDTLFYQKIKPFLVFDPPSDSDTKRSFKNQNPSRPLLIDLNRVSKSQLQEYGIASPVCDSILAIRHDFWFNESCDPSQIVIEPNASVKQFFSTSLSPRYKSKSDNHFTLEVNTADTSQLVLLKGIGSVLAKRIVQYRQLTGGFYHLDQLLQVYGFSPVTLDAIKPFLTVDRTKILPLNINKASLRRLKDHPLLGYYKAQAIIDLRKQSGSIHQLNDVLALESFAAVDKELFCVYFCLE